MSHSDPPPPDVYIPSISLDDPQGFADAFGRFGFAVLPAWNNNNLVAAAAALRTAAYTFFRRPVADKQRYASGGTYGPPGWAAQGLESVQRSMDDEEEKMSLNSTTTNDDNNNNSFPADAVESFVYHGPHATVPPELQQPLETYHTLVNALLDRVMETCAQSQGLPPDFFRPFYQRRSCALRLAYYPAGTAAKYGAHTDYTGFTLLNTEKSGLQVLYEDKQWIDVPCDPQQIIINAGDLLPIWTNGRFTSAIHRVVPTPELTQEDRLSIVYFTGPSDDTLVEPIVREGETRQYEPVLSGEHLQAKLSATNKQPTATKSKGLSATTTKASLLLILSICLCLLGPVQGASYDTPAVQDAMGRRHGTTTSPRQSVNATAHKIPTPEIISIQKTEPLKKVDASATASKRTAQHAASVRRIQSEWKDMVKAGMAYNWKTQQPVLPKGGTTTTTETKPHHLWVGPLSKNLWVWHFSFCGMEGTAYAGGIYHGRILLPPNYPGSPPKVQVLTPTGRFVPGSNICLSASHFHPETWTASWTVRTLIESLRLHMLTTANEIGGMEATRAQRESLARASRQWQATVRRHSVIHVNHAAMIAKGLFPAWENDREQSDKKAEDSLVDAFDKDNDTELHLDKEEKEGQSDGIFPPTVHLPTVRNNAVVFKQYDKKNALVRFLKSPLKIALLGLAIAFVFLNVR